MKKHQAAADTAFLEAASKSSMLNDLVNTGVMATVIGGFALIAVEFISRPTIAIEPQQAPERHDLSLSAAQVAVHAQMLNTLGEGCGYACICVFLSWKQIHTKYTSPPRTCEA